MSKPLPTVSKLSRLGGIADITEYTVDPTPGRAEPIRYSLIDFESDSSNRHAALENQLVRYDRHSRNNDNRAYTTSAYRRADSSTKSAYQVHFPNAYTINTEHVSNPRAGNDEEHSRRMPDATNNRSARDRVMAQQQFDAIWDPAQGRDLTVHLRMDVHEDFTDILEELCCLQRLGDFSSARSFFEENLREHFDDPYVQIQYGEILLEQGDYLGILKLGPLNQQQFDGQGMEYDGMRLLSDYWDLILFFAECHYNPRRPRNFTLDRETLWLLQDDVMQEERDVTSTEIKYLALLYQLCGLRHPEVAKKGLAETIQNSFSSSFHRTLYQSLLRQGRIWDLRDIVVARMAAGSPWMISAAWSTNADFRVRLHDLVTEWTNPSDEYDMPTLLALLDMLTSLVCWDEHNDRTQDILTVATQVARLIIDHHPEAMKTKPFIQWMLLQCESSELGSRDQLRRLEDHLDSSPGILYRRTRRHLAQYAPYKAETPGWVCEDGPPELLDSVRMALKTCTSLSDYRTQARALQLLILMSASPIKEFEKLGKLQKFSQGDNYNFAETLAARYVASNDDASRQKLRDELAAQWSVPGFSNGLSAHQLWILCMIRYALARDDTEAERALSEADTWYRDSPAKFVEYVNKKMPTQRTVYRGNRDARAARSTSIESRSNRRHLSVSPTPEPRQRSRVGSYGTRVTVDIERHTSDYERESERERRSRLRSLSELRDHQRSYIPTRSMRDIPAQGPAHGRTLGQRRDAFLEETERYSGKPLSANKSIDDIRFYRTRPPPTGWAETVDTSRSYRPRSFLEKVASLDEIDSNRGESRYRDEPPKHQAMSVTINNKPAGQNVQNAPGRPDAAGHEPTHNHPQAAQSTLNRETADESAMVPLRARALSIESVDKHEENDTTRPETGSQTEIDTIKPPSRAVTMEAVKDVGERKDVVGSPTGSDQD
ncbi:hypothetical protein F4861DRAFT_186962 [Xylaria intraflava]|nr:hypothetical protein F4861DRAFT_186962 [Xylaria intraflava]